MKLLTDGQIQTILNALSNSRRECETQVNEAALRGGKDDQRIFQQSADQYIEVADLIENAGNVAIDVRERG